ncbi:arylacetamide deacetylase-like [Lingula anatina]|uniref:Arylacetamide deacetylase-like n=1 Tax=Lingula anatina TaxID=7574 RepID=A0A1S3K4H0_LINAN|nr:arylacetamide deacetylase-like [Lingula anatina]|eukprot:XP_013417533.1 arylacetamide deacetylase-like [Lingula anatina]
MRCCGARCLLLVALAVAGLAYIAYVPVPDDFDNPWEIRPIIWSTKLGPYLLWLGEKLGYGTELEQLRALFEKVGDMVPPDPNSTVKIFQVTKTKFNGVNVRVYDPNKSKGKRPALIYLHGGGWTMGSSAVYDSITRSIAEELGMVVVSVDYRLAPEHKYPAGLEDSMAVTVYLLENSVKYNVDPNRVAVGGDSAGGNLAAAVALKLRDQNVTPVLKQQLLIYPALQAIDNQLPSAQQNSKLGIILKTELMVKFWLSYSLGVANADVNQLNLLLNNQHLSGQALRRGREFVHPSLLEEKYIPKDYKPCKNQGLSKPPISAEFERVVMDPYFSPVMAETLQGVPEACLITAEYDILRDDGLLFKRRLEEAKVKVTHHHYKIFHGIFIEPHSHMKMFAQVHRDVLVCLKHV